MKELKKTIKFKGKEYTLIDSFGERTDGIIVMATATFSDMDIVPDIVKFTAYYYVSSNKLNLYVDQIVLTEGEMRKIINEDWEGKDEYLRSEPEISTTS